MPDHTQLLPLEVRDLTFEAGGQSLLNIPRLALADKGPTIILGPNGAGKSLLLRLLHGLLIPTGGTIRFGGKQADAATQRRQAMVLQKPVLLRRSVAANIDFVLRLMNTPAKKRNKRLEEILNRAGLAEKAHQSARTLSGGEAQRLALIRAITLQPEILFLDEPTSSLDPGATLAIEHMVEAAAVAGTKIVMVTHDLGQARRLAADIVFCHDGRVAEHSGAKEFFEKPRSEFAMHFLKRELVF